jgi:hypothetical protein
MDMMDQIRKEKITWTWKNSLPYIIAGLVPTILLIMGFIGQYVWALIWMTIIIGIGIADVKSMDVTKGKVDFEKDDSSEN